MIPIKETESGVIFQVHVLPGSSRCEVAGVQGEAIKLKITAPPHEGRANAECIVFLSHVLGIKKSMISLVRGHRSRKKTISITGLKSKDIEAIIPLT
ncbi:MAG: DUF167 domain-containing protein [Syntrophales bacterium]